MVGDFRNGHRCHAACVNLAARVISISGEDYFVSRIACLRR
jgi:hypothetical protein